MTILEQLIQYANNCIEDKYISEYEDYISGEKHKWACIRFLNDVKKIGLNTLKEPFPFVWDEEEAQKIVEWFKLLRHSKGVLAGKPIELNPWQMFTVCQIYGWRYKDTGYRRFNKSFIEVGRKNAKSQMESGIALYEISCTSVKNNEVCEAYSAGVKRKQSKVVFDEAALMLKGSPLRAKFKVTRDRITHIKTGSYLEALNKEDGKKGDGSNPAILIIDEYHQHPTTEFYDLGLGSNTKESLLMIITTAGVDLTYPCYTQEYEYCSKILNPNVDVINENYFVDILEIDKGDDIGEKLSNKRIWKKANPIRMTYPEGIKKISDEYEIAKNIPEKMTIFLTKCLNKWVQAKENGYMDMEKWKACQVDEIPYDLRGKVVFVGFDMSSKIDLTSVAFVIPILSDEIDTSGKRKVKYIIYSHSFIPSREKLQERVMKDKVSYDAWERAGFITITNTPIVDQQQVIDYVVRFCEENEWEIDTLCFDPTNASKMMMDLRDDFVVEEVFQSHKSLNEATQGFREEVISKNVIYLENPVLNFAMSNAVITSYNGLIKIDKDANKKKIDPVDAVLCGYKLARYYDFIDDTDIDEWLESDEW